jgi:hypothetical protein
MMRYTLLLSFCAGGAAHGMMTLPPARNSLNLVPGEFNGPGFPQCAWFTAQKTGINATVAANNHTKNCDPAMLTLPPYSCNISGHLRRSCADSYAGMCPWFAPGTAPSSSPCGVDMPHMQPGQDGRSLPKTVRSMWKRGGTAEVGWSIAVNHGGCNILLSSQSSSSSSSSSSPS